MILQGLSKFQKKNFFEQQKIDYQNIDFFSHHNWLKKLQLSSIFICVFSIDL